jgi:large subunit ribosomal protein L13
MLQRTYTMKKDEIQRTWWVVDAAGKPVGRVAAQVARLLQGKHKPTYTPHMDMGDHVIILNAEKAIFTGNKLEEVLYHHTMHPGGLRAYTRRKLMTEKPERMLTRVVSRMLPKNKLRARMLKRLRVFAGAEHPTQAQQPQPYSLEGGN